MAIGGAKTELRKSALRQKGREDSRGGFFFFFNFQSVSEFRFQSLPFSLVYCFRNESGLSCDRCKCAADGHRPLWVNGLLTHHLESKPLWAFGGKS